MAQTADPRSVGIVLIGDELLSGKRADKHMPAVIDRLHERGMELAWARMVGDDAALLTRTLQETMAGADIVFSFGGIGATPDDRTRQCAAAAAGVLLEYNAEGRAILEDKFGDRAYPDRIHMVEWPVGSTVIPNPVNRVPGFSLGDHHFVPGFPNMAWPMVTWVLDTHYANLHVAERQVEYLIEVLDTPESALIGVMQSVMDAHPEARIACLPSADGRRAIEFGVRGRPAVAADAFDALHGAFVEAGLPLGVATTR
ncbi:molybdopterin-binding protein [Salinisphaera sp. Q1T1-3]|uniref:competence/damage-inducible protein A n=1 Tax=Salinisphaera sp. Q1T1-3 TaxID=2321229 RepID=UPI000E76BE95|nr:molybdopterin-binding protein [Salinisphaera sp. Q1T1-3]RJS92411.1 competence/damage-inducible protein A [Salinisphaera sp. Q1T1-3]